MILENGRISEKKYWQLKENPEIKRLSFTDAVNHLDGLLNDSVRLRLIADVPVGVLLSGGMDSSLIAALAARKNSSPVFTFTSGNSTGNDEREFAGIVSKHINSRHTEFIFEPSEFKNSFEDLFWLFDDLSTFDAGIIAIYYLMKRVEQHGIKVLLFGDGADELFAGYSWYGLSKLPFSMTPAIIRNYFYYYATTRMLPHKRALKTFYKIHKEIQSMPGSSILAKISAYELTRQLPNHYLTKVDRATMGRTIEGRVPFLDHRIVEFGYSLPDTFKMHGSFTNLKSNVEKRIEREVAGRYLPSSIYNRKKRGGFSIPLNDVLIQNRELLRSQLLSNGSFSRTIFSADQLEKICSFKSSAYHPLEQEKSSLAWKLFITESWLKRFGYK